MEEKKIYASGTRELITYIFLIFAILVLVLLIYLIPYIQQNYQVDLEKVEKTTFNIIFYSIVYFLVIFAFFIGFAALFYSFLYSFSRKIMLTNKTLIFKEVFRKIEVKLKDITLFAIGKVDIVIVFSTGYGPMGSISKWDYPSIYYKKDRGIARLVLPWFKLEDFIDELRKKAPWIKIKIPKKYLEG